MPKLIGSRPGLRKGSGYKRVYSLGEKLVGRYLLLFYMKREDEGHSVGITVSSKVGGAVTRNLIRRRIKEALRQTETGRLDGRDSVFVAIRRISDAGFEDIKEDIHRLMDRVR